MSIQYFYNFCLKDVDRTDLGGDLLSGVRKSYYQGVEKIKDKITSNSETDPYTYDFSIEKDKPMKWLVKDSSGTTVQNVMLSDNGKYYIYFYHSQSLWKRLLFSKHHTLLKIEYFDAVTGDVRHTLEPRKSQNGLCILYTVKSSAVPIPLFEAPQITDVQLERCVWDEFDDYTVAASTDGGIVRFLSESQLAHLYSTKEKCETELAQIREESFVGGDTPLLDKINAKDFNVKRNLSSLLDITCAMEFGVREAEEESPAEADIPTDILASDAMTEDTPVAVSEPAIQEETADLPVEESVTTAEPSAAVPEEAAPEDTAPKADKLIMADGAVYSYFGELDENGNRSGCGRTLTELGRTAYEGNYVNDKRSGYGSYYYKDGTLCYSGEWRENVRHGVGVGISSRDGSIHAGSWKNNKPEGSGVRLSADGDIRFVCRELSDGTTVLMHFMPDDTVILSKYDEKGMKTGEKPLSLKDLP